MSAKIYKAQAIFNKVCKHLMRQGHKAMRSPMTDMESITTLSGCVYRADNGDRCAIGCLIPAQIYLPEMEGNSISGVHRVLVHNGYGNGTLCANLTAHRQLLMSLQGVHDEVAVKEWPAVLRRVAMDHGLTIPAEVSAKLGG